MTRPHTTRSKIVSFSSGPSTHPTGFYQTPDSSTEPEPRPPNEAGPRALRIEREGAEPALVPLHPDRTYVFGRAPESGFVFASDAVSRLHAQLRHDGSRWTLRDLNSRNGTHLLLRRPRQGEDPRHASQRLGADGGHLVLAGETFLLGNNASRLVFLAELPQELVAEPFPDASPATRRLERSIGVCASHRLPVFLFGRSGSGKTHVARAIHERSRVSGNFVILNCGRLPLDPAQLASELLGHMRGSFTGAIASRKGKLHSANEGTLFLDEVDSLSREAQEFLLDVLEGSGSYAPFGASEDYPVEPPRFRLISASKVTLASSGLRPDLCQRLAAGDMIVLPSLEERRADIPALIDVFLARLRDEQQLHAALSPETMNLLQQAEWPGEIRELEATVRTIVSREHAERMMDGMSSAKLVVGIHATRDYLEQRRQSFGPVPGFDREEPTMTIVDRGPRKRPADLTAEDLRHALILHEGNKTRAAAHLGIALNTLKAKLRSFGILA